MKKRDANLVHTKLYEINKGRLGMLKLAFVLLVNLLPFSLMATPSAPKIRANQIEQTMDHVEIPSPLKPWVSWVNAGLSKLKCAQKERDRVCTWPSHMNVNLTSTGASFDLRVSLDVVGLVPLIYQDHVAIKNVQIQELDVHQLSDQNRSWFTAPIIIKDGRPWVELDAGVYTISGELLWDSQPDLLQLPHAVATISLSDNGKPRMWTQRDNRGAPSLLTFEHLPTKLPLD